MTTTHRLNPLAGILPAALLAVLAGAGHAARAERAQARPVPVAKFTPALLRHQATAVLDAPVDSVWAVVGSPARLPEYSSVESVEVDQTGARIPNGVGCRWRCHFTDGSTSEELTVHFDPPFAWAALATTEPWKSAGDLSVMVLEPLGKGRTIFTWRQYYDVADLRAAAASYEQGIGEITRMLVARFGGYVVAPATMEGELAPASP